MKATTTLLRLSSDTSTRQICNSLTSCLSASGKVLLPAFAKFMFGTSNGPEDVEEDYVAPTKTTIPSPTSTTPTMDASSSSSSVSIAVIICLVTMAAFVGSVLNSSTSSTRAARVGTGCQTSASSASTEGNYEGSEHDGKSSAR